MLIALYQFFTDCVICFYLKDSAFPLFSIQFLLILKWQFAVPFIPIPSILKISIHKYLPFVSTQFQFWSFCYFLLSISSLPLCHPCCFKCIPLAPFLEMLFQGSHRFLHCFRAFIAWVFVELICFLRKHFLICLFLSLFVSVYCVLSEIVFLSSA